MLSHAWSVVQKKSDTFGTKTYFEWENETQLQDFKILCSLPGTSENKWMKEEIRPLTTHWDETLRKLKRERSFFMELGSWSSKRESLQSLLRRYLGSEAKPYSKRNFRKELKLNTALYCFLAESVIRIGHLLIVQWD